MWFVGAGVAFAGDSLLVPSDLEVVPTRAADRHVTLLFLGRVPEATALQVWRSLPQLELPPTVQALGWERFGRSAIAVAIADDRGLLSAAADACHTAAASVVDVQRPSDLRPHVTLARVPRRARPPTAGAVRDWPVPDGPVSIGPLTLFCSRSNPDGDRYEVVAQQVAAT